ncbi:uncharacterized protein LOC131876540 [Cryptomeria japonica]|uniref:uncharacterized protein LOC131876540 n=1 Tax=Cryptomeria japonica TaxID=3369 RepID=UPI0027DA1832|nr:uncharacterized protein LOC131876540 [Cryptomeria japonica]
MTDLANGIKAISGHFEECDAHKILLTLPKSYKPQRCVIQESNNLSEYTIDRRMGTLVAYEISEMEEEKREKKEAGLSVSRHDDPKCSGDLEEAKANFVRRWQRGTRKCEGKLPLKCFSCGRIGHYSSSYTNREDYKRSDDDEKKKKFKKHNFNRREKKGLCYIEEHTFEDEVDDDSNEESLFLAIEDKEDALKKPKEERTVKAALHAKIKPRLRHSLLSMSQMCIKGYEVLFSRSGCVIRKEKTGKRVSEGVRTCGNVYYINYRKENKCLLAQKVEIVLAAPEKTSDPKESKEKETNDEEEEEDSTKIPTKYV